MKGKTKIKKIDNKAARQVAFSKRRRGLFSKAEQLSQLCDAKVAIIIFSTAGRPYSYSSCSMKDIIAKYEMSSKKSQKQESELLNKHYAILCEEVAKKSQELRQLKGEGLEGLEMEQLQSLEDKVETSIENVRKRIEQAEMLAENGKLRQMLMLSEKEQALDDLEEICNGSSITLQLGLPSSSDE
uniref:MADS-box domain-containing protein n=2 Tax=Opuntia streptacantha TaxID=393608 RepID=A0A7C8Z6K7_OPUST